MPGGRPTKYRPEYCDQGEKLCKLGATDDEIDEFLSLCPTEDEWLCFCLILIKSDRKGVIAARKRARSIQKKEWLKNSPSQRIRNAVSARMWAALKGRSDGRLFSRLGYSADRLVQHIGSQFTEGMTWDNYGQWHIDHIIPCAAFDLTDNDQFNECWALGNLRPLWASDNTKKGAKHGPT